MPRSRSKNRKLTPYHGNPVAKILMWRRFQKRIVKSGKGYKRVSKSEIQINEEN